jgi:uncharacterized membrane protein
MRWSQVVAQQDARHRLIIALIAAGAVFFLLRGHIRLSTESIVAWDVFAFSVLVLAWFTILTTPIHRLRARAKEQDASRFLVFLFVVVAARAALLAVGFLISVNKGQTRTHFTVHLILGLLTVILAWSVMQTVFSLRYAHIFYGDDDQPSRDGHAGGLIFPGKHPPDYFDFAYFSFVVGMTCQVSDVQITSRRMRRVTLVHSILSFGFNTLILALLINTVSGLL